MMLKLHKPHRFLKQLKPIKRHKLAILLINIFISLIIFVGIPGNISYAKDNNVNGATVDIVYFYITACKTCNEAQKQMESIMQTVKRQNKKINPLIHSYSIEQPQNLSLLNKYYDLYKIAKKEQILPVIFVGNQYFTGKDSIEKGLESVLQSNIIPLTPTFSKENTIERHSDNTLLNLNLLNVVATGFVSGLNPCALSMLLFFISLLLARTRSIIKMGLAFCVGKFITYILLGTFLFSTLSYIKPLWYSTSVKVIIVVIMLTFSLLYIRDFIAAKNEKYGEIRMQLPKNLRKFNHNIINTIVSSDGNRIIILLCLLLGIVISIGEFLCAGQLFLVSIIFMMHSQDNLNVKSFIYLVIYTASFNLPIVVTLVAIEKGKGVLDLAELVRKGLPLIKMIMAALFLIYSIVFLILY